MIIQVNYIRDIIKDNIKIDGLNYDTEYDNKVVLEIILK